MKTKEIQQIHESLVNGQRKQMVRQIDEYGKYSFLSDYKDYLQEMYVNAIDRHNYFVDAAVSYDRIKNR